MVLITARVGVPHRGRNSFAYAVVALTTPCVRDLDVASTVECWRLVSLPVTAERDKSGTGHRTSIGVSRKETWGLCVLDYTNRLKTLTVRGHLYTRARHTILCVVCRYTVIAGE